MSDATEQQPLVYFFGAGRAEGGGAIRHLVGGKGASLADMTRAGLNVPPGFTISAECCDHYFRSGKHWLVDTFQPAATFAPTNAKTAKVTAVTDFAPGAPAEGEVGPTHVSSNWAFVPFAFLGVFVVGLAGFAVFATMRNRRLIGAERRVLPPFPERFRRSR